MAEANRLYEIHAAACVNVAAAAGAMAALHVTDTKGHMAPVIATRLKAAGYHCGPDGALNVDVDVDVDVEVSAVVIYPDKEPPMVLASGCPQSRQDGPGYILLAHWLVTAAAVCPVYQTTHVNPNVMDRIVNMIECQICAEKDV